MYSSICPKCGFKSMPAERYCPECGTEKEEKMTNIGLMSSVTNAAASKLQFLDRPELYVQLFFRSLLLLGGIFLIPDFITKSEFFWICCTIYTISALIKNIDRNIPKLRGIYNISRVMFAGYLGAGFGNLISYTGRGHSYTIGYFFNPGFLVNTFLDNSLILIGMISGICLMLIILIMKRKFSGDSRISM